MGMTEAWQPERAQSPSVGPANFVIMGRSAGHCVARTVTGKTSAAVV
jgi:hypothetical protein